MNQHKAFNSIQKAFNIDLIPESDYLNARDKYEIYLSNLTISKGSIIGEFGDKVIATIKDVLTAGKKQYACCIVQQDNKILFLKRHPNDDFHPGTFCLPSGGVEPNEEPEGAAIRELKEETMLTVISCSHAWTYNTKEKLIYYYFVDIEPGEIILDEEHSNYEWMDRSEWEQANLILDLGEHLDKIFELNPFEAYNEEPELAYDDKYEEFLSKSFSTICKAFNQDQITVDQYYEAKKAYDDQLEKAQVKYIRRTGSPGNYKYIYEEPKSKDKEEEMDDDAVPKVSVGLFNEILDNKPQLLNKILDYEYSPIKRNIDKDNYYLSTGGTFNMLKFSKQAFDLFEELKGKDGFIFQESPKSDSKYLIDTKNNILYRLSDHWGRIASCKWWIDKTIPSWAGKTHSLAKINMSDLKDIGYDRFIRDKESIFNNIVGSYKNSPEKSDKGQTYRQYIDKIINEYSEVSNGKENKVQKSFDIIVKAFNQDLVPLEKYIEARSAFEKAIYKNNPQNRKLGRVGQHYGGSMEIDSKKDYDIEHSVYGRGKILNKNGLLLDVDFGKNIGIKKILSVDKKVKIINGKIKENFDKKPKPNLIKINVPKNIHEAKDFANNLFSKINDIKFHFSGYSDTNGQSIYYKASYKDKEVKVRISDHSVSNINRVLDEVHFNFNQNSEQNNKAIEELKDKLGVNDITKSRSGVYADNAQNKQLKRVGQKYWKGKKQYVPSNGKQAIQNNTKQSKPYSDTELVNHAKNASEEGLNRQIKTNKDPKIREIAHKELERRGKEEYAQEDNGKPTDKEVTDKIKETKDKGGSGLSGSKNISEEKQQSLYNYIENDYRKINNALRKDKPDEEVKKMEYQINSALDKLEPFNGILYRVESAYDNLDKIAEYYKSATEIEFPVFILTTQNKSVANGFDGDVFFEIKSKNGRDISDFSGIPNEKEVLFKSKSQFKVKSVKMDKLKNGTMVGLKIRLEEI